MAHVQNPTLNLEAVESSVHQYGRLPGDNEERLLQKLRAREESGYEELVTRYGPQVMAIAGRYLQSREDVADCFQDTFIAIFDSIGSFQQRSSMRHWIRGVAVNQSLMKLRQRRRRREESIEHMLPMFDAHGRRVVLASPGQVAEAGDLLDADQRRTKVRECIDNLPEDCRIIILLRDIDGYPTREAAAILGISVGAAKTRLHRARSALKFLLEPILERKDHYVDL